MICTVPVRPKTNAKIAKNDAQPPIPASMAGLYLRDPEKCTYLVQHSAFDRYLSISGPIAFFGIISFSHKNISSLEISHTRCKRISQLCTFQAHSYHFGQSTFTYQCIMKAWTQTSPNRAGPAATSRSEDRCTRLTVDIQQCMGPDHEEAQ